MRFSVPNALGYLRLALGAVFFLLAWHGYTGPAAAVFLVAMATDVLDGYFARKLKQESKHGIVLDALSDKLVLIVAFLFILLRTDFPAWISWVAIGYHALTLLGLFVLLAVRKKILEHAWTGKLAAVSQTVLVPVILLDWHASAAGVALTWFMVAVNLLSVAYYTFIGIRAMRA